MKLKILQQSFIKQLIHQQLPEVFLPQLQPCGNLSVEQQLAIYQNNVRGALQTSLAQVYPVCHKILGDRYFKQLASVYIKDQPSRHNDLNQYGEFFTDFIGAQYQQRSELKDFPYLSDLVQFEWFYQQVYYAAEGAKFDFSAFAALVETEQAQCVFQLNSCLRFICSDYPVLSIWQINQNGADSQQGIKQNLENCCIFRQNNQIELHVIDTRTYQLLKHMTSEKKLEELVQLGYENDLPGLIKKGWITGFKVKHV